MTKIYGLFDPLNGELRYVGKTIKSPKKRLDGHLQKSSLKKISHKNNWIKSLLSSGLVPEIFILDEVEDGQWEFWEQWHILYWRGLGCRLTNIAKGGECPPAQWGNKFTLGRTKTADERLHQSQKMKGHLGYWKNKKFSIEHRALVLSPLQKDKSAGGRAGRGIKRSESGKLNISLGLKNSPLVLRKNKENGKARRRLTDIDICEIKKMAGLNERPKDIMKKFNIGSSIYYRALQDQYK